MLRESGLPGPPSRPGPIIGPMSGGAPRESRTQLGYQPALDSTATPDPSATAARPDPSTVAPTQRPSPGTPWHLPVKLLLVGDSQANMLDLNAPPTVAASFQLVDGWVEGCGVLPGRMTSSTP